jgi:hypothetical protein
MIWIKDKESRYRNTLKKMKATSCTRGLQIQSKAYEKPMKLITQIIQQVGKKQEDFSVKKEVKINEIR